MLHREVPGRASSVRARPARPGDGAPSQGVGVLQAAAREAEDQAHLRAEREAVPQHVREGQHAARHHGPQPARRARDASRQRGVPHGLRRQPQGGAPAHPAPPRRGEPEVRRHPELPRAAGPGSPPPREVARAGVGADGDGSVVARRAALVDRGRQGDVQRPRAREARRARASRSRRRSSWSSSSTRSNGARAYFERFDARAGEAARRRPSSNESTQDRTMTVGRGPNPSTSLPRVGGEAERFRCAVRRPE